MKILGVYFVICIYEFLSVNCDVPIFNGRLVGDQSIEECVNGQRPRLAKNSSLYITTSEMIEHMGYPAENHVVVTEDGYILTIHRIPGKPGATPVFLQHGIVCSSFDWIVSGPKKGIAFLLADAGYDVWMGNARGNTYSRCHTEYSPLQAIYWDFSWHEMGVYDLPAAIKYITDLTGKDINYVGHSMGTTMFYVMAIERPDIASRVKVMYSLSPVAYIYNLKSPLKWAARYSRQIEYFVKHTGIASLFPQSPIVKYALRYGCNPLRIQKQLCTTFIFAMFGFDAPQFNYTLLPMILSHMPAGVSIKTMVHYYQEMNSGRFQYYDYGIEKNLKLYNSTTPPDYDISKIQVPIGIFWSDNDLITDPEDLRKFYNKLPKKIMSYRVKYSKFNHVDFIWAIDADKLVYSKLISSMEDYR